MRDPCAVEAVARLALLVLVHARKRDLGDLGVAPARDEGGHSADGMRAAGVTGTNEKLGVGPHERHRHRHLRPVRQHELGPLAELLDDGEDVVPPARVEPGGVLAELVEDLLHLERREDRLDEDRRLDRPARDPEVILREAEDVVPQPCLDVALELREVEVRPRSVLEQSLGIAVEVHAEVEEPAGDVLAVDLDMTLLEMPAARADQQHGDLVVQRVALVALLERDRPLDRVREVLLAADDVLPRRRVRVLQVGHVDTRTGVERVDDHLAVARRPGDLDAAVLEIGGDRRDPPVALANVTGRLEEVGQLAGGDPLLPLGARVQQLLSAPAELALERDDEVERLGGEDARLVGR